MRAGLPEGAVYREPGPKLDRDRMRAQVQPLHDRVLHSPVVIPYGRFSVVRDDLLFGGTKMRYVYDVARKNPDVKEWCFAGPAWGGASIAVTSTCFDLGLRTSQFYAWRKNLVERQKICEALGARLVEIKPGYLTNVRAKARRDVALRPDAKLIEWGVPDSREAIERIAKQIPTVGISEVWCAYGSGTLLEALYNVFAPRGIRICTVGVGAPFSEKAKAIADRLIDYPKPFAWRTRAVVPFPSCRHYDAKCWEVAQKEARGRALIWNVARDHNFSKEFG